MEATKFRYKETKHNANPNELLTGLVRENRIVAVYGSPLSRKVGLEIANSIVAQQDFMSYKCQPNDYYLQHVSERHHESVENDLDEFATRTGVSKEAQIFTYSDILSDFETVERFVDTIKEEDINGKPLILFEGVHKLEKGDASAIFDIIHELDATVILTNDSNNPPDQFIFHADTLIRVDSEHTVHVERALGQDSKNEFMFLSSHEVLH